MTHDRGSETWVSDLAQQAIGAADVLVDRMDEGLGGAWQVGRFVDYGRTLLASGGWANAREMMAHLVGGSPPPLSDRPSDRGGAAGYLAGLAHFFAERSSGLSAPAAAVASIVSPAAFGDDADIDREGSVAYQTLSGLEGAYALWMREFRRPGRSTQLCVARMAVQVCGLLGLGPALRLMTVADVERFGELDGDVRLACFNLTFGQALWASRRVGSPLPFSSLLDRELLATASDGETPELVERAAKRLRTSAQQLIAAALSANESPARLGDRLTSKRQLAYAWLVALGEYRPALLPRLVGVSRAGGLSIISALRSCGAAELEARAGVRTLALAPSHGGQSWVDRRKAAAR
jgi:hypothetical protein